MNAPPVDIAATFAALGIEVLERGWLSSNNVLFDVGKAGASATLVDTGYELHAGQTVAWLRQRLGGRALGRVINTHLHSDHCGGNAALQREYGCEVWVPAVSLEAVRNWDEDRLTYRATDQACARFEAAGGLHAGSEVWIGARPWQAWATPGHDSEALVYFEPRSRVLIAGDALWRERLAIVFQALAGGDGFVNVRHTLDLIASLAPRIVIPGHGAPFTDVAQALLASRHRLAAFEREPEKHFVYALRALAMFHLLEHRRRPYAQMRAWMAATPVLVRGRETLGISPEHALALIDACLERLIAHAQLTLAGDVLALPPMAGEAGQAQMKRGPAD